MSHAGNFLSAIQLYLPVLRRKLSYSWHIFKNWKRFEHSWQATPMTPEVLQACLGCCLARSELRMMLLLRLGFNALLRTGELLGLRRSDLTCDGRSLLIHLAASKGGSRLHRTEHVVIRDRSSLLVFQAFSKVYTSLDERVWEGSPQSFRQAFTNLMAHLGIAKLGFRPYSLRRGGATSLYRAGVPTEAILIRGRWSSNGSARGYINDGLSMVASLSFSSTTQSLLQHYCCLFPLSPKASV